MAQVFFASGGESEWRVLALDCRAYAFGPACEWPVPASAGELPGEPQGAALLLRADADGGGLWVLVDNAGSSVRVNGLPLHAGIRVLAHRDEIRFGAAEPAYFSTERLARVEPYDGEAELICPRCRSPILVSALSVVCPNCLVRYHQDEAERPCWLYGPTCVACGASTDPDAGFRWSPSEI